jgi:hypothetical protein
MPEDETQTKRSQQWVETYRNFVSATHAYANHPETPDSIATPLLDALDRLRERLDDEDRTDRGDWIPEELDA